MDLSETMLGDSHVVVIVRDLRGCHVFPVLFLEPSGDGQGFQVFLDLALSLLQIKQKVVGHVKLIFVVNTFGCCVAVSGWCKVQ